MGILDGVWCKETVAVSLTLAILVLKTIASRSNALHIRISNDAIKVSVIILCLACIVNVYLKNSCRSIAVLVVIASRRV